MLEELAAFGEAQGRHVGPREAFGHAVVVPGEAVVVGDAAAGGEPEAAFAVLLDVVISLEGRPSSTP